MILNGFGCVFENKSPKFVTSENIFSMYEYARKGATHTHTHTHTVPTAAVVEALRMVAVAS
jgi:hypothetical protein